MIRMLSENQKREKEIKEWYEKNKNKFKYDDSFGVQALCPSLALLRELAKEGHLKGGGDKCWTVRKKMN